MVTLLPREIRSQHADMEISLMRNVRMRKRLLLCLVILGPCLHLGASIAEAQRKPSEKDFVEYRPSARVRVIPDLAKYGDRTLLLDLYLPAQLKQGRPGVIVVRGGGWMVNHRKRFAHLASDLAEKGVAAACIEYRTAEEAAFPGAIQDVKAAERWMRANAARYGIDSQTHGPPALRFPEPIACYGSIPQAAFWRTRPEDSAPEFSGNPLWLSQFPCWPRGTSLEGCNSKARAGC